MRKWRWRVLHATPENFLICSDEIFDLYYGDLSEEEKIEKIKKELLEKEVK